ncbi:helix-turn-helix domain-containing protein [Nocardia salmonicida]|uniref:helix-turn-helix domain-containing protein n=1 Tax=Nocardia salmonicida TaxID=53431 RepID=UPI0007A53F96|nr:helix-turn-helix transcriptional regulator [Nocardia salmonicida]MBC7299546.1 helix-turn-helix domain-containing protein [Nocardia sp.]
MPQQMRQLTVETPHQVFGAELRHWRTLRGLSQAALGAITSDSGALIGKVEKADRVGNLPFAQRMDSALNTGGALERMWRRMEQAAANPSTDTADAAEELLPNNPWATLPVPELLREWQASDVPDIGQSGTNRRRIGQADIDIMWTMCNALTAADRHLGGGYARDTLTAFLRSTVAPALHGTYDASIATELHTVSARLADLAGFMAFDTARQTAARKWFGTGLVLARAAGNVALGAHIFADMAMQAHHTGRRSDAVTLAETAVSTARQSGSPSTVARSSALLARAHALAGDRAAAARALAEAEHQLDRAQPAEEPAWIRFFGVEQLAAEAMYVASDAGQFDLVQHHAPLVLAATGDMERRYVLASSALASSHMADPCNSDADHAAQILIEAIPAASTVVSSRGLDAINTVRRQLAPHSSRDLVQQVEKQFAEVMVPIG